VLGLPRLGGFRRPLAAGIALSLAPVLTSCGTGASTSTSRTSVPVAVSAPDRAASSSAPHPASPGLRATGQTSPKPTTTQSTVEPMRRQQLPGATSDAEPAGSAAARAPAGCSTARSGSYKAGGASYLLSVPAVAAGAGKRVPLVLSYHGYQQSAAAQEAYTGLGAYGAAHGVAVASIDGAGGAWNFPRSPALRDDLAVSRAVVADVRARLCGQAGGVAAAGWSDGADMAALVACTGIARAVVSVAPSIPPRGCTSWPPMTEVHGTADPLVPYAGGGGSRGGPFASTQPEPALGRVTAWARSAGCAVSRSYRLGSDVAALRWDGCDVLLYTVLGGGHTWPSRPGADPVPGLGTTTTTLSADALVVDCVTRYGE